MMKRAWTFLGVLVCCLLFMNLMIASYNKAMSQEVDLVLILGFDVSQSVDTQEYELQRDSYADALIDPRVIRLLTSQTVALSIFEWAENNAPVVACQIIRDEIHLREISSIVRRHIRRELGTYTAVGSAIANAVLIARRECPQSDRVVFDISGDGISNHGVSVTLAVDTAKNMEMTINTMPILDPTNPELYGGGNFNDNLISFYRTQVQTGYYSFTLPASSFENIREMLVKKLVMEVTSIPSFWDIN